MKYSNIDEGRISVQLMERLALRLHSRNSGRSSRRTPKILPRTLILIQLYNLMSLCIMYGVIPKV